MPQAFPKEAPLAPHVKPKGVLKTTPAISDCLLRLSHRLPKKDFDKAKNTASRIAKRGRPDLEYQMLLLSATLNFLKFSHEWLRSELDYMAILLLEAGSVRSKTAGSVMTTAHDYLSFIVPHSLELLYMIHDDHEKPKGLMTPVDSLRKYKEEKEDTLYDRDDDYQKEVLAEDDDLYF